MFLKDNAITINIPGRYMVSLEIVKDGTRLKEEKVVNVVGSGQAEVNLLGVNLKIVSGVGDGGS